MRNEMIQKIIDEKVIAIVRGIYGEDCLNLAKALYEGGVRLAEITFDAKGTIPAEETAQQIATAAKHFEGRMYIGAGTVLTVKQAQLAIDSGAEFMISPNVDEAVIRYTKQRGVISMPGAFTPSEAVNAVNMGADFVKIFPSDTLGPKYFKAISAPLSHIKFIAVGGVDHLNVGEFLKNGAVGVGVSSNITRASLRGVFSAVNRLFSES